MHTRRLAKITLLCSFAWMIGLPHTAHAYPWMIRHDYTGCATCHTDPSGAGLLTPYGRAQSDLLLRMRYGEPVGEEPDKSSGFMFGAVTPPDWLNAGAFFRGLGMAVKEGSGPTTTDFILMQADAQAEVRFGGFRANVSLGAISTDQSAASIAGGFISREHWLGYSFSDDTMLVRAGRINLPFGIRSVEHTLFVRQDTRTDLNDTQQDGVAFAYSGTLFRGEIMGILGNYQVSPDAYRERGYSGYIEMAPLPFLAFGVSSLVTYAKEDVYLRVANLRQAQGVFARVAPVRPLVLLFEADYVGQNPHNVEAQHGYALMLQADVEPIQGLHAIATAEASHPGDGTQGTSWGGWLGVNWFFLPHADLRVDVMKRTTVIGNNSVGTIAYMAQLHAFL